MKNYIQNVYNTCVLFSYYIVLIKLLFILPVMTNSISSFCNQKLVFDVSVIKNV